MIIANAAAGGDTIFAMWAAGMTMAFGYESKSSDSLATKPVTA